MAADSEPIEFDPKLQSGEWIGFYQAFGSNHRHARHGRQDLRSL